jgi:hypothetical protein
MKLVQTEDHKYWAPLTIFGHISDLAPEIYTPTTATVSKYKYLVHA